MKTLEQTNRCGNLDCLTGVCRVMFRRPVGNPALARQTLISPPGVIEGPPGTPVQGLVCSATNIPDLQKDCSEFVTRTQADDERDQSI